MKRRTESIEQVTRQRDYLRRQLGLIKIAVAASDPSNSMTLLDDPAIERFLTLLGEYRLHGEPCVLRWTTSEWTLSGASMSVGHHDVTQLYEDPLSSLLRVLLGVKH